MSTIRCPHCGHPPPAIHPGAVIHCDRCQQTFQAPVFIPLEPLVQPEMVGARKVPDVDGPSGTSAFLAIFAIVGFIVLICGGIGGSIAINTRKRVVAAAQQVEEVNKQREAELKRQMQSRSKPISSKPVRKKERPPTPIPPLPPDPPVRVNSNIAPPPDLPPRTPRPSPTTKSVDDLIAELNGEPSKRPACATLQELARRPVEEDRQVDVSAALNKYLSASDSITAAAAAKAAVVWGTEWNGDALLVLLDSSHHFTRADAIRALAKVRPTAETAELLLAKTTNFSNHSALRDAFKTLGPIAEQAMLDSLESNDLQLKKSMLPLLGEIGTSTAIEPLEKALRAEMDSEFKRQADGALRRIRSRLH